MLREINLESKEIVLKTKSKYWFYVVAKPKAKKGEIFVRCNKCDKEHLYTVSKKGNKVIERSIYLM